MSVLEMTVAHNEPDALGVPKASVQTAWDNCKKEAGVFLNCALVAGAGYAVAVITEFDMRGPWQAVASIAALSFATSLVTICKGRKLHKKITTYEDYSIDKQDWNACVAETVLMGVGSTAGLTTIGGAAALLALHAPLRSLLIDEAALGGGVITTLGFGVAGYLNMRDKLREIRLPSPHNG